MPSQNGGISLDPLTHSRLNKKHQDHSELSMDRMAPRTPVMVAILLNLSSARSALSSPVRLW